MKDVGIDRCERNSRGFIGVKLDHDAVRIAGSAFRDFPRPAEVGGAFLQIRLIVDVIAPLLPEMIFAGIENAKLPFNPVAVLARGYLKLGFYKLGTRTGSEEHIKLGRRDIRNRLPE